jgi:hypothetical protein
MIWDHQESVGELRVHTGSRKTDRWGEPFRTGKSVGVDKNHTTAQKLRTVLTLRTVKTSIVAILVSLLFISVTSRCTYSNLFLCKR